MFCCIFSSGALIPLFRAGLYDAIEDIGWAKLGQGDIGSRANLAIRDEAALQSFVLLKNDAGVLPLTAGTHIAVLGPQSSGTGLFSDYFGDDVCWSPHPHYQSDTACATTIATAISAANIGGKTTNATGVAIDSSDRSGIAVALALAKAADVIVLALGRVACAFIFVCRSRKSRGCRDTAPPHSITCTPIHRWVRC